MSAKNLLLSASLLATVTCFPQLESFDQFFEKFGSSQFSPSNSPSTPSRSARPPQFQQTSSNAASGKSFPTAVPYVHDPSGDGPGSRPVGGARGTGGDRAAGRTATNQEVNNASHEAALQRAAQHRKQLEEVIAQHRQVLSEREEEIVRASAEQIDVNEEQQTDRSVKPSSNSKKSDKKGTLQQNKFPLQKFLRTEKRKQIPEQEGLTDIQNEVVENLDLIGQLAEQIAELDARAYQVFSKQKSPKPRSFKKKKKESRKESKRDFYDEEGIEDEEDREYLSETEREPPRAPASGRIRNVGLRIRQ